MVIPFVRYPYPIFRLIREIREVFMMGNET